MYRTVYSKKLMRKHGAVNLMDIMSTMDKESLKKLSEREEKQQPLNFSICSKTPVHQAHKPLRALGDFGAA